MQNSRNSIFLFLIFSFIYFLGSFTKIPFGDCMGFVLDTEKGIFINTVTPTSHFLYINIAIILKKVTGLNSILVNRLLVIGSAAFVVVMVYKTVNLVTRISWISIVASFVFGFSFTFWKNAEIVEVYSFNMLWISLFIHYLMKTFLLPNSEKYYLLLSGFFLSISLWTHIENILFIPSFLLLLFYFKENKAVVLISMMFLISSFSLMFWLNSIQNIAIKSIFTGQGNWVEDSFSKTSAYYLKDLLKSFLYLIYNFNVFVVFGIFGAFQLFKIHQKLFYVMAIAATLIYGFSTFYAVSDNYVFFLPFNFIFALGIGLGLKNFKYRKRLLQLSPVCLLIPFFYLFAYFAIVKIPAAKDFGQSKSYKGGLSYYMLPWMNNNVGILEFTIEKKQSPEPITWMISSANQYIKILQAKGYTLEEIKKL